MEGVLTPEIWVAVAGRTGIDDLLRTTREEPDYEKLMRWRIDTMDRHGLGLSDVLDVVSRMDLLPGAAEFLAEVRSRYSVVVLSDTFEEFAGHLRDLMGRPHVLCHRITVDDGRLVSFTPRVPDAKCRAVDAYQSLGYHVTAVGDSFNDLAMLTAADAGFLFRPPQRVVEERPSLRSTADYDELLAWIDGVCD
ncbi:MAG TPA: bifunctional phosphoserine phosphatase/homoserine phosphotransferase ThrH [Acidimicrobiaceae bacterium]|nr:bifunctional phosphoserine phosphatase/homoserine phosphotransferase ThrH [Acidimicrobiaceae bacterium]HCB37920.1 bifunctional phosphoserine phosphatase/homoserine phosphotransferase ThrH [Acidimicrobiaceae bacterium]